MPYLLSLNQFYKIWFSKNSDQFLGQENQLRLVILRYKHPTVAISLIYSSACLSNKAQHALYDFCSKHQIIPVDFDTSFKKAIEGEQESVLYHLAQAEIAKRHEGGNLAAASDIVRLLTPAIALGLYSDFDVALDCRSLPTQIRVRSPILFCVKANEINGLSVQWQFNNEMIGIATNQDHEIHPQAHKKLFMLRNKIIMNYAHLPDTVQKILDHFDKAPYPAIILQAYHSHVEMDIFKFRQYIQSLSISQYFTSLHPKQSKVLLKRDYTPDLPDRLLYEALGRFIQSYREETALSPYELALEQMVMIKHRIYVYSVLQMTGPSIFNTFLENNQTKMSHFYTLNACSVFNSPLEKCMVSQSTLPIKTGTTITECLETMGKTCDLSWTEQGAKIQVNREAKMNHVANIIQSAWKRYRKKQASQGFNPFSKKLKLS